MDGKETKIANKQQRLCRRPLLVLVRQIVEGRAALRPDHVATVCDAREVMAELRWDDAALYAAAGEVFKAPRWAFTGCWAAARHVRHRARLVKVWRMVQLADGAR